MQQAIQLMQRGKPREAIGLLNRELGFRPHDPAIRVNLAIAHEDAGDLASAERGYRLVLAIWPNHVEALSNYANLLARTGRLAEAAAMHRKVLAAQPGDAYTMQALAFTLADQGRIEEALELFGQVAEKANSPAAWSLYLSYGQHVGSDPEGHKLWAQRYVLRYKRPVTAPTWDGVRPLRIGYLSGSFRQCATASFFEPLLGSHNRNRVHVTCYSDTAKPDDVTARLHAKADAWRNVAGMSDERLAMLIRSDSIDVLVELDGHKVGGRLLLMARNPAPVCGTLFGYCSDTGVTQNFNIGQWAYQPNEDAPPVSALPANRNDYITFGSFNRVCKITRQVAATWAKLLARVGNSRLVVLAQGGEHNTALRTRLESAGIPGDRLKLIPHASQREYLAAADAIDIHLDTFPYNGVTTTADLLWQGVPTITLRTQDRQGRCGAELLTLAGLPDLVAYDEAGYLDTAAKLAADVARLTELRLIMRDRLTASPLLDGKAMASRMEDLYADRVKAIALPPGQPAPNCDFGPETDPEEIHKLIDGPTLYHSASDWHQYPNVQQVYRDALRAQAETVLPFPEGRYRGQGVVVVGGGDYFVSSYVTLRMIRAHGYAGPIELWMRPGESLPRWQRAALEPLNITVRRPAPGSLRADGGWELKVRAMLESDFEQVVFFDADCYPVANPAAFFDWPEYHEYGLVLWPDRPRDRDGDGSPGSKLSPDTFAALGIPHKDEWTKEAAQLVIDKRRHWHALNVADWMNQHSDYYYRHVYGDKDTLWLACLLLSKPYAMIPRQWADGSPAILGHDFAGNVCTVHRCNGKFTLDTTAFPRTRQGDVRYNPELPHEDIAHGFADDLRGIREEHRPRIHAVSVSVNHADYLSATIDANKPNLADWSIITTPEDHAAHAICETHGLGLILSDRLHAHGSKFNVGALRNDAYRILAEKHPGDWILSLDDDIRLPADFWQRLDAIDLDPANIYGATRYGDGSEQWDKPISGFFQLFHTSHIPARQYKEDHEDAGWTDVWFRDLWPEENRVTLPIHAQHLGHTGVDWDGRISSQYDPEQHGRLLTDQERWAQLHRRPFESPDLSADGESRWLRFFTRSLPCSKCRDDWNAILADNPPRLYDREPYARSTWEYHNAVNRKLGKPQMPWKTAARLYDWLQPFTPERRKVKVFGLQRTGTNLAAHQIGRSFDVDLLTEDATGWKHGPLMPIPELDDARFVLCIKHPLAWLVSCYRYYCTNYDIDVTMPPQFMAGMTFAEYLALPVYDFANPMDRWNRMYRHWLDALPAERTAIVRHEDQVSDQVWVLEYAERRLGLARKLDDLAREPRYVSVCGKIDGRAFDPAPYSERRYLSCFTPEMRGQVAQQLDADLLAHFGYLIPLQSDGL